MFESTLSKGVAGKTKKALNKTTLNSRWNKQLKYLQAKWLTYSPQTSGMVMFGYLLVILTKESQSRLFSLDNFIDSVHYTHHCMYCC